MDTAITSSENEGLGKYLSEENVTSEPTPSQRRKLDPLQDLCQDTELDKDVNNIACRQHLDEGTSLKDDEVRWLIIGVCLHKIISPTLRKYVPRTMQGLYANLKHSDNIDTQTFAKYLRRYTPSNKELNYEAINSNSTIPKHRGRPDIQIYDYMVHDEVDLSKLFLPTSMANYTGFDDTCDSSALLGIIINVDIFPAALRHAAETVRNDVRNEWAHCNFSNWDMPKFQNSFMLMKHMIGCLNLPAQDERDLVEEIDTWEQNGVDILHGAVGFNVLRDLKKETKSLAEYCQSKNTTTNENFKKIQQSLTSMLNEFESLKTRISVVERKIEGLSKKQNSGNAINYFTAPNRIEVFVGRENELKKLEENFSVTSNKPCIQAISGLGGMGKTSLATEYSWKNREQYPGGVFWVSIDTYDTLLDSFQQLATGVDLQYTDGKQAMREFLRWLSTRPDKWLLVADNLDSDELTDTMAEFLFGPWKRDTEGHVLITTRREGKNAKETFKVDCYICLDKLTTTQSINFLKTRAHGAATNAVQDAQALGALAKELDGLPLALEQAAAHVKCIQCTFREYWKQYEIEHLRLLKAADQKSHVKMSRERLAVQTTWNMNFDYIKMQSEKEGLGTAAVTVMEIFALLPADFILLEILNCNKTGVISVDGSHCEGAERIEQDLYRALNCELRKKQVLEILSRFSVVKVTEDSTAVMHRLVQNIIQKEMTESHRYRIETCLVKMIKGMTFSSRANWSRNKSANVQMKLDFTGMSINVDVLRKRLDKIANAFKSAAYS